MNCFGSLLSYFWLPKLWIGLLRNEKFGLETDESTSLRSWAFATRQMYSCGRIDRCLKSSKLFNFGPFSVCLSKKLVLVLLLKFDWVNPPFFALSLSDCYSPAPSFPDWGAGTPAESRKAQHFLHHIMNILEGMALPIPLRDSAMTFSTSGKVSIPRVKAFVSYALSASCMSVGSINPFCHSQMHVFINWTLTAVDLVFV